MVGGWPTASRKRCPWEGDGQVGLEPAIMKAWESLGKNRGNGRLKSRAGARLHPCRRSSLSPTPPVSQVSTGGLARNEEGRRGKPGGKNSLSLVRQPAVKVESTALSDFAKLMERGITPARRPGAKIAPGSSAAPRLVLDQQKVKNGLGRLVLALVKLLHELLERQALRRIDAGYLNEAEIDRLGLAMMAQAQEIDRLRRIFGLEEADLNLDLGPLGKLL